MRNQRLPARGAEATLLTLRPSSYSSCGPSTPFCLGFVMVCFTFALVPFCLDRQTSLSSSSGQSVALATSGVPVEELCRGHCPHIAVTETEVECDCDTDSKGHERDQRRAALSAAANRASIPDLKYHVKEENEIVAVLWDSQWGNPFYWGAGDVVPMPNYAGYVIQKTQCPIRCTFTIERSMITIADVVLFDPCMWGTDSEWKERPPFLPEKREGQSWVWYAYEQEHYFRLLGSQPYLQLFDHNMTYSQHSFVQITFMCAWGSKEFEHLRLPPPPKSSDLLVSFIASNCASGGAAERTVFVKELMKYIPVDSFGLCLHNKDLPEGKGWHTSFGQMMDIKMDTIAKYKFFLAFENTDQVEDYVTEKVMNALLAGTLPVYRGAPNIEDWLPGEHSVINVKDFASARDLANYLHFLDEHPEEYEKYFEWKKKPFRPGFEDLLAGCVFYAECRLCQAVRALQQQSNVPRLQASNLPVGEVDAYALEFNTIDNRLQLTDDSVVVPHSTSLDLTNNYTLMAWINLGMIGDGRIIDKARAGEIDGYEFDVLKAGGGTGVLRLCAAQSCFLGSRHLSKGLWYHVAVTFQHELNRSTVRFYVNGQQDPKIGVPQHATASNIHAVRFAGASVGATAYRPVHKSGTFTGLLDDLSIWNRCLAEKEIRESMFKRLTGREEGLAGYWGLNEGSDIG
ncbi:Fucosyltransferase, variant 2 [Balamuthia mandrillaris]